MCAGRLSGGERAQLALTLALAKHPPLLVLDEPMASLDPLACRSFLGDLMEAVAEDRPTVLLSSHSLVDVERVCDYLVVVAGGRVRVAGLVDELLDSHWMLTGPRQLGGSVPGHLQVIDARSSARQATLIVRGDAQLLDPRWSVARLGLEELVLAYMRAANSTLEPSPLGVLS